MPLYRYKAQDAQGRDVEGSLSAADAQAAQAAILRRGLRLFDMKEAQSGPTPAQPGPTPRAQPSQYLGTASPTPSTSAGPTSAGPTRASYEPSRRNPVSTPQKINQLDPYGSSGGAQGGPQRINMPQDPPVTIKRTKPGNPKSLAFIFTQLASFFNAGYNPAQALETVANQQPNSLYRDSLLDAAKSTSEGSRFSRVLERYPDLYPKNVPGMIRAGEMGGYLPEAVNAVAEQAESARKIGGWVRLFTWWTALHALLVIPGWLMIKFVNDDMDAQFKSGGTANTGRVFLNSLGNELKWPVGPLTLLIGGGCFFLGRWLMNSDRSELRDRILLKIPAVGKRARSESLAIFSWTLSMVSRAGIPPKTTFELAIGAMPNVWMQHQLRLVQARMQDGTKLSEAIAGTKLLPDEYAAILQTGEMVGDVSSALMSVSGASTEEFQRNDKLALARIGCWGLLVMIIATGILIWFVLHDFYPHLIQTATSAD